MSVLGSEEIDFFAALCAESLPTLLSSVFFFLGVAEFAIFHSYMKANKIKHQPLNLL